MGGGGGGHCSLKKNKIVKFENMFSYSLEPFLNKSSQHPQCLFSGMTIICH